MTFGVARLIEVEMGRIVVCEGGVKEGETVDLIELRPHLANVAKLLLGLPSRRMLSHIIIRVQSSQNLHILMS